MAGYRRGAGRTGDEKSIHRTGRWLAVRSGSWKLIDGPQSVARYDLWKDPGEAQNQAAEPPARVRDLQRRLEPWLATETLRAVERAGRE